MGWMDKHGVMQADVFVASILVKEEGEVIAKEYKIKNAWDMRHMLAGIRRGAILNIKGLGKLKIMSIFDYDKDDNYLYFYELIFSCRRIEETAIVPYEEKVTISQLLDAKAKIAKMEKVLQDDYQRTWG
jgi:hypothetical protein